MGMYNTILVTLDCSDIDRVIIDQVIELAKIHHSQVNLVHVLHSHTLDQKAFMLGDAQKRIQGYEQLFKDAGIPVNVIIKIGEPEEEILNVIDQGQYDLIAMATHGHQKFLDFLYGSVSDTLKHKIDIPILLIRGKK